MPMVSFFRCNCIFAATRKHTYHTYNHKKTPCISLKKTIQKNLMTVAGLAKIYRVSNFMSKIANHFPPGSLTIHPAHSRARSHALYRRQFFITSSAVATHFHRSNPCLCMLHMLNTVPTKSVM